MRTETDWNETIAKAMAKADSFRLSEKHWEIIHFARQYYAEHQTAASICALAQAIDERLGRGRARDRVWQEWPWCDPLETRSFTQLVRKKLNYWLGPRSPLCMWQALKYAGLPNLPYRVIVVSGKRIELDGQGYLVNHSDWNEEVATVMARADGIELTDNHWEVINFLREYYEEHQISLFGRMLTKTFGKRFGPGKGNNRYLYELFPNGPSRQAVRYAGLLKPCVDP